MLLKRNLLQNLTIISSCGTITCVLLNYITNISLITGIWLPLYIIALFIISVLLSFKCIQWLLQLNKPLKYDLDKFGERYPYLAFVKNYLPNVRKPEPQEWKEYDTNELSVISTVLERNLVSSWYVPYVSQDIGFPFACKQMLDQMIGNAFKICHKIETKDVFIDLCTILSTHFKEYRKALKRQEKSPDTPIESFFKTSHPVSEPSNKYSTADHCANIVRMLMKDLIPYELWDSPHAELLVRILAKRLDAYIESTIADPVWINDRIVTYLTGEEYVESGEDKEETPAEVCDRKDLVEEPESLSSQVGEEQRPKEIDVKPENIVEETAVNMTPALDIKSSPILRQRRGRQGRNEVKIYDRIIEGSTKTWETDMDLQCISLGQDLLATLDGEITLSRLWGADGEAESSPERAGGRSPQPLWFGEELAFEMEEAGDNKRESSPKAADIMRDLSTTVSHAKTKIGDLQVGSPETARGDEAAGMMEGLLDFGIAGLKKGLRFTGLSDDSQDKSPSLRDRGDRSPTEARHKSIPDVNPAVLLQKADGENGNGAVPVLVKQHRVTSQDSVPILRTVVEEPSSRGSSPEPQYEEAADLSSSIAKLRCLLLQRDPQPREEEVWWEGAEETRGRTLPLSSRSRSRPVDSATLADEYDMSMDRSVSPNHSANNMQRLDKLFQRTVTGVFNSLKTAVGGEDDLSTEVGRAGSGPGEWRFVSREAGAGGAAGRLLAARPRRAPRTSRTAPRPATLRATHRQTDDLEECEASAWCAALGAACASCAAPHAAYAHSTHLLQDVFENIISAWLVALEGALRRRAFEGAPPPPAAGRAPRPLDPALTERLLLDRLIVLQVLCGRECVRDAVRVSLGSVLCRTLVRSLSHRALDVLAVHARAAAITPSTGH